jgi:general L-amino acid transport system permease protein
MMVGTKIATTSFGPAAQADLPPPASHAGVWAGMRRRLFPGPASAVLSLLALLFLIGIVPPLVRWAVLSAVWTGSGPTDCPPAGAGACWIIIGAWLKVLGAGFYPQTELWRPLAALLVVALALVPAFRARLPTCPIWIAFSFLSPFVCYFLLHGGLGLETVPTSAWGGLLLTLVVGLSGIAAALPLGILLALARRSDMPVVRLFATLMIELPRGVPLITLLFMASVMLPLFLPSGVDLDKLARALVVVALFEAAYMAEIVRAGLQAIAKSQTEAAEALGLGYWQTARLIVLPQALRLVIPGIVNTFIGLFKDTTLVSIIGLFDLLGVANAALQDAHWLGRPGGFFLEIYAFVALVFFVFCFAMSRISVGLERRLDHSLDGKGALR